MYNINVVIPFWTAHERGKQKVSDKRTRVQGGQPYFAVFSCLYNTIEESRGIQPFFFVLFFYEGPNLPLC